MGVDSPDTKRNLLVQVKMTITLLVLVPLLTSVATKCLVA